MRRQSISQVNVNSAISGMPFQCDVCGKAYSSKCNLKKHQETHGPKTECYCGCSFSTKEQYARHLKGRHMGGFECTVCNTVFSSRLALLRHTRREHARTQELECTSCGKKFGHKCHLREHFAVHTEETPYQCVTCGKKYKFQRSLRRHTPLCSGGIPRAKPRPDSECHICGKMFSKRRYLTQHLQTHENSTKLCSKCGKKFVFESSFFKHVKHCAKK